MKTRLLKACALLGMLLFVYACGSGGGGGGGSTGGGGTTPTPKAAKLDITTDNYVLNTNGLDTATLTVVARDASNAAVSGVVVDLSASAGLLSVAKVTTGADGTATVTFSPGPEKSNLVVTVTATSGTLSKDLPLTIFGTTLTLTSSKSSLLANATPADKTTLTVSALDASNNPISGAEVTLTSAMGNLLSSVGPPATGPANTITVITNASGKATATLTAGATPGTDTITAKGLEARADLPVNVTSAKFGFTSPNEGATIAVNTTTPLTLTWTNAAGSPVSGQVVTFTTTGGYFDSIIGKTSTTAATNASGQATVSYTAGSTATPADISATSGIENATLHLLVASINPSRLNLQASPSVLSPSVGGVSSSSTITATVRDASNQLVNGEQVVFTIITGPGGGESLSPGTAVTDAGGTASVTFTSGSAASAMNGVKIRATIKGSTPSPIFAETTLTIGQQATSIVLGTTNKIAKVTVGGLEVGYALPFSVLVVDSNGNPIPNATVNLGIYPLHFYTGFDNAAGGATWTGKFSNEDQNRNGILDPGEDAAKGFDYINLSGDPLGPSEAVWNSGSEGNEANIITKFLADGTTSNPAYPGTPNGRLDPGGVVTIPVSVVTDNDGLAAFQIKYAKAYGNWIQAEITATTSVAGDLSTAKIEPTLGVLAGDIPYLPSPFGF